MYREAMYREYTYQRVQGGHIYTRVYLRVVYSPVYLSLRLSLW